MQRRHQGKAWLTNSISSDFISFYVVILARWFWGYIAAIDGMLRDPINKSHAAYYDKLAADQGHSGPQDNHAILIRTDIVFR
jgi:hypothetical protein